jgi:hypothetical protein
MKHHRPGSIVEGVPTGPPIYVNIDTEIRYRSLYFRGFSEL